MTDPTYRLPTTATLADYYDAERVVRATLRVAVTRTTDAAAGVRAAVGTPCDAHVLAARCADDGERSRVLAVVADGDVLRRTYRRALACRDALAACAAALAAVVHAAAVGDGDDRTAGVGTLADRIADVVDAADRMTDDAYCAAALAAADYDVVTHDVAVAADVAAQAVVLAVRRVIDAADVARRALPTYGAVAERRDALAEHAADVRCGVLAVTERAVVR